MVGNWDQRTVFDLDASHSLSSTIEQSILHYERLDILQGKAWNAGRVLRGRNMRG